MNKILIKNVLCNGHKANVLIEGNRFKSLNAPAGTQADKIVEAEGMAMLPPFYNMHTHMAMSLLRGYADDMDLHKWLTEYIWPYENKMTSDDMYEGSRLAIREMVKSGSVFFSDMYFDIDRTIKAVEEAGVRAAIGITFMNSHSKAVQAEKLDMLEHWTDPTGGRISLTIAPHAIYTVGADLFSQCAAISREKGMKLHTHLAETAVEVRDCIKEHGTTPVRYLDSLGVLADNVILAHVVHVDREEAGILAKRGVTVVHCPCSNMKLSSGIFPYKILAEAGVKITLGTDGDSSNNCLDMREEMKFAALLAKVGSGDPAALPADEVFDMATRNGAEAFGIDAGVIAEGKLADALLINLNDERMTPCYNLISNWVYSADTSCIDTVICDGRVLMQNRELAF